MTTALSRHACKKLTYDKSLGTVLQACVAMLHPPVNKKTRKETTKVAHPDSPASRYEVKPTAKAYHAGLIFR